MYDEHVERYRASQTLGLRRVLKWRNEQKLVNHETCKIVKFGAYQTQGVRLVKYAAQASQNIYYLAIEEKSVDNRVLDLKEG